MFGRKTRYSWLVALLALGLALFTVTGCDEDDDDDDPVSPTSSGPTLTGPTDGGSVDLENTDLVLDWNAVDGATMYQVQVAADPGFGDLDILIDVDVDSVDTNDDDVMDELPSMLEPQVNKLFVGVEHFWRVRAMVDGQYEDWSDPWSFEPTVATPTVDIVLEGEYMNDVDIPANSTVLIRGGVFIGSDDPNGTTGAVTLTIGAGTTLYGESATDGMLVIRRGGAIQAIGTAAAPIVFTSDKTAGQRGRGDWGGVIINGEASLNTGVAFGEGDTGPYGGSLDTDNSGTMRYCRIEFAGREISPDNELNGLALQGVGSETTIEYIQVHMNKDDGVEFFGGTARARYMYVTGCADDQFDWTDGWRGYGQFWICQQYADDADQGIEADNNGDNNSQTPFSNPTIANLTLIGAKGPNGNDESDVGMLLREGTKATIVNAIVQYFGDTGLDIDGSVTGGHIATGDLSVMHAAFYDNETLADDDDDDIDEEAFITDEVTNFVGDDPMLGDPYNVAAPNFMPGTGSFVLDAGNAYDPTSLDGWFMDARYIGAMSSTDWISGWTTGATN